ncbi:hypothetical protein B9Z55_006830 [Caenorhabditis nigoni]|uniref:Uncharacterized protein n=1 Tax=Caenorhabditis nigoni TaxID=1611254 RepID=A0A2G5V6P5_9PELO|nr:hypothetical protein B9Z55_006830 [Caenorhabditis nigoni]
MKWRGRVKTVFKRKTAGNETVDLEKECGLEFEADFLCWEERTAESLYMDSDKHNTSDFGKSVSQIRNDTPVSHLRLV